MINFLHHLWDAFACVGILALFCIFLYCVIRFVIVPLMIWNNFTEDEINEYNNRKSQDIED